MAGFQATVNSQLNQSFKISFRFPSFLLILTKVMVNSRVQLIVLGLLTHYKLESGDQLFLKQLYRCQVWLMCCREEPGKIPKHQILRGPDLLKFLPLDTKLFDNVSSSDSQCSQLSGPFSDVVYNVEAESKRKAKKHYGKDLYTAFSFSPEFKTAMEEIKKEMIKENPDYLKLESLVADNVEEIKASPIKAPTVTYEFLKFPGIDYEVESNEEEEEEVEDKKKDKDGEKDVKKKKIWWDEDDVTYDDMSGYWRMLSAFDEFKISPPWYDAYAEGKVHWMQTEPIPAEILENSRKKCLSWLSKNFDK